MTSAEDHLFWRSLINERDLQTNGGGGELGCGRGEERRGDVRAAQWRAATKQKESRKNTRFQQTVDEQPPH